MDIVDAIVNRLAQTEAGVLPNGGADCLRKHPRRANLLYQDLLELEPNEYVEFAFAMVGIVWGEDGEHAAERLGHELVQLGSCVDVSFRWTGEWRIGAIPWDDWVSAKGAEEHPSG